MTTLEIVRGDKRDFSITVTQDGAPLDLTGLVLWFTAKRRHTDPDQAAAFQLSSAAGGISITDAVNGKAEMSIQPGDTSKLPASRTVLVWDLQVVDGSGNPCTPEWGSLTVIPDVTRRTS
ncbi:hypothetical protein LCGC14_1868340 [marine sediment metagenome]|uniref:BppU N-terminal domain-containing protein n=1 Tax=marine sediment metagenome TaxID=412755 RepID=A0A0F9J4G4_9ZZZZ